MENRNVNCDFFYLSVFTINNYKNGIEIDPDLIVGPLATSRWSGFEPIIADFVTDDLNRVEIRKDHIEEWEWERTFKMGKNNNFII